MPIIFGEGVLSTMGGGSAAASNAGVTAATAAAPALFLRNVRRVSSGSAEDSFMIHLSSLRRQKFHHDRNRNFLAAIHRDVNGIQPGFFESQLLDADNEIGSDKMAVIRHA